MRAFILVVERDLHTREVVIDMCAALGHLALGASTPYKGLRMLEMMVFQAMVISPGATLLGEPSYAVEAKKIQPKLKVIMTAAVELPDFLKSPIDAFIQKPFPLLLLKRTLTEIFIQGGPFGD